MEQEGKYIPREAIETQGEPEQELSPEIINAIMAKVKDFTDEETRRHIGVHNMGGEGDGIDARNIEGGLFKTEKILTYGLLSPQIADRLGVRTSHGYGGRSNEVEMHPLDNVYYYERGRLPKAWSVLVDTSKVPAESKRYITTRDAKIRIPPRYFAGITVDHELLDQDLAQWLEAHGKYEELIQTMYEGGVIKKSESVDAKIKSLADMRRERNRLLGQIYPLRGYGFIPSPPEKAELERQAEEISTAIRHTESELIQDIERSLADDNIQQLRILLNEQVEKARDYDNAHVDEKGRYLTAEYGEQARPLWEETEETKRKLISALLQTLEVEEKFKGVTTFRDYLNGVCAQYTIPLYSDQGLEFPVQMNYEEVKEMLQQRSAEVPKSEVEQPEESTETF